MNKILVGSLALVILAFALSIAWIQRSHRLEMSDLRNQLAERDRTIEVQKGVYERLSVEKKGLEGLLDDKNEEEKKLLERIKDQELEVLSANKLVLKWKSAYEGALKADQQDVPSDEPGVVRKKVDFSQDFGDIGVRGWTLTDPAQAWIRIEQLRPLRLTLLIMRDEKKQWRATVTSSERNVAIEVQLSAVDPHVLELRWYEKLQLDLSLGAGDGILGGVGISYPFGNFSVGPMVYVAGDSRLQRFIGLNVGWRPFQVGR